MKLSPGAIVGKVSAVARRFPISVAALAVGVVLTLMAIHDLDDVIDYRLAIFLPVAMLSSIAGLLAVEDGRSRWMGLIAEIGVPVLWGVRCLFLPEDSHDFEHEPLIVEFGVVVWASFLAIFFTSFLRRDTDTQWWNFSARLVLRLILGSIFSLIFFGGFALAIYAVSQLFDVDPPEELFGWLAVGCFMVFAPLYVMAGVPVGEEKRDGELTPAPVLKVLALYILGPILAVYTLILYLYLFKIIITWELPVGWVSWLVTTLAVGGLVVSLLLYPLRMRGAGRIVDFLARWTGVIIAPLLVLMTVGIARRISDYGFTPNRCYILLLNLWFYGVYAWLFVVRGRRVKWILISAVVVGLLSSVGPWSLARVTPRHSDNATESYETSEDEEAGEWFSAENTLESNMPYEIGGGYDNFAKIYWFGDDVTDDGISVVRQGYDLVVGITGADHNVREFRVPMRQAVDNLSVRGNGFLFLVGSSYGTRYPERDSIRVSHLDGYLFY